MAAKGTKALARGAFPTALAALVFGLLTAALSASAAPAKQPCPGVSARPCTIVIGFLGGYVSRNSAIRSEVKMAKQLKADYAETALVETFENRRIDDADKEIVRFIAGGDNAKASDEQKRQARVVIYGHSWGGWATIELARKLEKQGIPVLLTVQVDSVSHWWKNDSMIPANVEKAINFYQSAGLLHGQKEIRAADASHTQILGNKAYDYRKKPVECEGYPFWDRWFAKTHMQIECDPSVWGQVESLIRAELGPPSAQSASN
jgi:dienelactone hydrolase